MIEGERVGRYRIARSIYEGDYATVFRGQHLVLDRPVALKIENLEVPDEIPEAMMREARLQAMVQHRNVLGVYDAFDHQRRVVIALEFVRTQSLADLLEHRTLPARSALGLFKGVVRGVRALHVKNIVHRDLKPENILLAKEEGRVVPKVADFGLAKLLEPGRTPEPQHLSSSYSFLGTPEYMAPEQANNPGRVDTRADMFSLGCLLYELIAHRVCFEAERPVDSMYMAAKGDYLQLDAAITNCPPGLSAVVDDLLRAKPEQRLSDCETLLQRLDHVRI